MVEDFIERLDEQIASIVPGDPNGRLLDTPPGVAP